MRLRERLRDQLRRLYRKPDGATVDALAMQYLRPLLGELHAVPPFTSTSLRPVALALLVNELRLNGRSRVLEFGCGVSTVVLAKAAQRYAPRARVLSIEQDASWVDATAATLAREGLDEYASVVKVSTVAEDGRFDFGHPPERLAAETFDLVCIDGPQAYRPQWRRARHGNLDLLHGRLADTAAVLVDDVDRPDDLALLHAFAARGFAVQRLYDSVGLATRGPAFDTAPVRD